MLSENNLIFSIGIPAYKALFLKECINSVLKQTYDNLELIIVNDASPENLKSIVDTFDDHRIRYFENEKNFGAEHVVDNWNKCLSYAKGDYFVLMGDDDVMSPEYIEEFHKLIRRYSYLDIYHCRSYIINEDSKIKGLTPSWPLFESMYENMWHRLRGYRVQYISDFVYKTSVLKSNGGFYKLPLAWASDDISSYIAMGSKGIAHIQKPLLYYRQHNQTISSTGNILLKMEALFIEIDWIKNNISEANIKRDTDIIFRKMIIEYLPTYLKKRKIHLISKENKSIFGGLSWWFKRRRIFKLSIKELFYAGIIKLKNREIKNG